VRPISGLGAKDTLVRLLVVSLLIFFSTLMVAGLVALGQPAGMPQWVAWLAQLGLR
jgi:hypothetical protein